ncbi:hypothetical protein ACB092_10G133800 [Castanea dentata]
MVDYFVDCHYSKEDERLWVIGGSNSGTIGYFPVNYNGVGPKPNQGIFGWTGAEDGRLCCWLSDESPQINRSWISTALIMRSPGTRKKNRHNPY